MATTFYFANTVTAPVSPTVQAAWNVSTGNTYRMMYPSKSKYPLSSGATITSAAAGAVSPRKVLIQTYMTKPLAAQTILSGSTISMQMRFFYSNSSGNTAQAFVYVRVCDESGANITTGITA